MSDYDERARWKLGNEEMAIKNTRILVVALSILSVSLSYFLINSQKRK